MGVELEMVLQIKTPIRIPATEIERSEIEKGIGRGLNEKKKLMLTTQR